MAKDLYFLYMFLYIFVEYIIYWMTRMTRSKDAWFVRGFWSPCTVTEQEQHVLHGVLAKAVASSKILIQDS